jgi:cell wall-associated NlpC family hydrolase
LEYLGWAYVWGGKSPSAGGFDCSGFVSYCYSQAGSSAPSYTGSLISWGYGVSTPQPGDVCVIHQDWDGGSQHTGIYYGNGQMIHASTFGVGVIIGRVQSGMVYRRSYDA